MKTIKWLRATVAVALAVFAVGAIAQGKTPAEKEVYAIYQASLKGDELIGAGKYAEAEPILLDSYNKLLKLLQSNGSARSITIPVGPRELRVARWLNLDFREIESFGKTEIQADRFLELLGKLTQQAWRVLGKDADSPDESTLNFAYQFGIRSIRLPVEDRSAEPFAIRLRHLVALVEGVLSRNPKLRSEEVERGVTAERALASAKETLVKLEAQAKATASDVAAALPSDAARALEVTMNELNRMEESIRKNGFVEDLKFERILVNPTKYLSDLQALVEKSYADEGRTAPAEVVKPVADKVAALRALAEQRAGSFGWPGKAQNPSVQVVVKAQLEKNLKGVKVLKLGMEDNSWEIETNDLDIPISRYLLGYVLYQMPGEKFARLSTFIYREKYAGGGKYTKANGASSYPSTRWQKASS